MSGDLNLCAFAVAYCGSGWCEVGNIFSYFKYENNGIRSNGKF